tara:strand:- start:220 stop:465 length:246 start_codon:yes stop_codon:yes gene_type:complete
MPHNEIIEKIVSEAQQILSPGGTFSINPCGEKSGEKILDGSIRLEIVAMDGEDEVRTLTCSEVAQLVLVAQAYSEAGAAFG